MALHLPPAIAMAVVVVLSALMARELGGGTGAQVLTMVATGTGVVTVFAGHILSTATIDTLFWVAISYAVLWTLQRDRPRGWLVVGVLAGVALEDKNLVAFLLVGDRRRRRADPGGAAPPALAVGVGRRRDRAARSGCPTCSGRRCTAGRS